MRTEQRRIDDELPREGVHENILGGGHLFPFGGVRKSGLWLRSAVEDVRREEEASSRALS
jgi:hypothetical protein